jgi:hypothetical protein
MARRKRTFWDSRPGKPVRYGVPARVADWRAGRSDGENGIPPVPPMRPEERPAPLMTLYLEFLGQGYQGSADTENLTALRDVADALVRRRLLSRDVAEREGRSRDLQKQLDAMPEVPDETVLGQRNATEQQADPLLVRTRRLREYTAARARVQAAKDQSDADVRARQVELAEVIETIAVRRRALVIRVTRLRAHVMRRRGRYLRHLVHRHPEGAVLATYFNLSSPELPSWLENWPEDEDTIEI